MPQQSTSVKGNSSAIYFSSSTRSERYSDCTHDTTTKAQQLVSHKPHQLPRRTICLLCGLHSQQVFIVTINTYNLLFSHSTAPHVNTQLFHKPNTPSNHLYFHKSKARNNSQTHQATAQTSNHTQEQPAT